MASASTAGTGGFLIIDHSRAKLFWKCPYAYYERYVLNIEPNWERTAIDYGSRMHELLAEHYGAPAGGACLENAELEDEAQAMLAAYRAHYPAEDFEVVEVEQTHQVALPCNCDDRHCEHQVDPENFPLHTYVYKQDLLVRQGGRLRVLDHKTESRSSRSNLPEAWASRPQPSLYQWAMRQRNHDAEIGAVIINILTRQSPKGREAPTFRREEPPRTREQEDAAVRWLVHTADAIEACERSGYWPDNRNNCVEGNFRCDYFALHNDHGPNADLDLVREIHYRPAKEYLDL